ncbi:hypothetical protein ABT297_32495 [Dactylosporangium sp. NPDC000555]|uniref:hypothetical protein n=1 Tax=Dactylosporangium sp. NPDC000555 TaxID=3154260 RepID=UPI00332491AB
MLIDVTTIIGAEEFILAQNRGAKPLDPFARQCFVELIQSIVFMSKVVVPHPTLADPREVDFGERPRLLRSLMSAGLIEPLHLNPAQWDEALAIEQSALARLQSGTGTRSVIAFIEQTLKVDDQLRSRPRNDLSHRIRGWADFQAGHVRIPGHHQDRINTSDGIEEDGFGHWARHAGAFLGGVIESVAPRDEAKYVMATLARGLKYRSRADGAQVIYQSHPLRRDFLITFDLQSRGASDEFVFETIQLIRGIKTSLSAAAGDEHSRRAELLELELPLLGGRLWHPDEAGHSLGEDAWIGLVTARIQQYREHSTELRRAIERCVTDEDYLRIARDIDGVRRQLLERLGLRQVTLSPVERELVAGVASVAESVPGVPKVGGMWLGLRSAGKQLKATGSPVQRFLYREFLLAWRRTAM